jgi:Thymidylate synthase
MIRFADTYENLVAALMSEESDYDLNQRTHQAISFLPDGYSFAIDLSDNILPTCGLRRTRPMTAAAEAAWCFSGVPNLTWLQKHTKIWDQFADADGNIMEAYGYRWKSAFGYDQIDTAIRRLIVDPSDRRVWISSWDPREDLLPNDQKTVPCPVGFTLATYENRLNSSLMIRSSDVFIGLPLDVMRHALVMRAIANSLGKRMGHMRVTLAHPHIYESHWDMALTMLGEEIMVPDIRMPGEPWTVDHIVNHPDEYVDLVRRVVFESVGWPNYDPKVMVVK